MKTNSLQIARHFLGKEVSIVIDRPKGSRHPKYNFEYEVNYGYVPNVKAPDGEDLDAYFLDSDSPLTEATGTCIAIIHREDDNDDKLVVVAKGKEGVLDEEIMEAVAFQEKWFESKVIRN